MKRLLLALVAVIVLCALPAWAKTRSGQVTMEFDLSSQPAGETVRLWIPYPVSDHDQLVGSIRFAGDYAAAGVYTVPDNGTPLLYAEWPQSSTSRKLTLAFDSDAQRAAPRRGPGPGAGLEPGRLRRLPGPHQYRADRWSRQGTGGQDHRRKNDCSGTGQGNLRLDRGEYVPRSRDPRLRQGGCLLPADQAGRQVHRHLLGVRRSLPRGGGPGP